MELERIVGSIVQEERAQPFVLDVETGRFAVGRYMPPEAGLSTLSVIQRQRLAQRVAEMAGVGFAQVRLGQYQCPSCGQWVEATPEAWGDGRCQACTPPPTLPKAAEPASTAPPEAAAPAAPSTPAEAPQPATPPHVVKIIEPPEPKAPKLSPATERAEASESVDRQDLIEKAIRIATEAHQGQRDKSGAPYILHPLRLMARMETPEAQMAAVLHDVVEDSAWTLEALRREGFPEEVVAAVEYLTRRTEETYEAFIERAAQHPLARQVKRADLEDNMDVRRLGRLTGKDFARLERYLHAWRRLGDH